jgi:N-acetylglucosaminyl-diphospho-decaprenol L-rhamnosyltransferase
MKVSIIIPVFNEVAFTRQCLESLRNTGPHDAEIIVIDNGSTDETPALLVQYPEVRVIRNEVNKGCAAAWNQGIRASDTPWIVFLNNDVVVSANWLQNLLHYAETNQVEIISSAMRESSYSLHDLNYNFGAYASRFVRRMSSVSRGGVAHGVCFMVHRDVFEKVGLFDEHFERGLYEDRDFFERAKRVGLRLAITGSSFIHHFRSVTQDRLRKQGDVKYIQNNRAYFEAKWAKKRWGSFWQRKKRKIRNFAWSIKERVTTGHTLNERWERGKLRYY